MGRKQASYGKRKRPGKPPCFGTSRKRCNLNASPLNTASAEVSSDFDNNEMSRAPASRALPCDGNGATDIQGMVDDFHLPQGVVEENCSATATEAPSGIHSDPIPAHMPEGRRIVDIAHLFRTLQGISKHPPFDCTFQDMEFVSERRIGLASSFTFQCKMCNRKDIITSETSAKEATTPSMDVTTAAVSGAVAVGCGFSILSEILASLNIPSLANGTFADHQAMLADGIEAAAWDAMKKAGVEEAKLARECGDVDAEGNPVIMVVADGAWSKRSYRTNYSAPSGVGAIIGHRTKRVLFAGVRNKFCAMCARTKSGQSPTEHRCFKNWHGSSTSMERDIIVEGFRRSLEMHGLKYVRLIADGDSSMYKSILACAPYGNQVVEKVECRNHILRNYSAAVRDIGQKRRVTAVPPKLKKLVADSAPRLWAGAACAIKARAAETHLSLNQKIVNLQKDIRNGPSHVFGDHQSCPSYFCKGQKPDEENNVPALRKCGLFNEVLAAMSRVVDNAGSLIHDVDNNIAEQFNSIVAKFVGGKRINYSLKRSYETRCLGAVVSFNSLGTYHGQLHKTLYCKSPGKHTKAHQNTLASRRATRERQRLSAQPRCRRSLTKGAGPDESYGPQAQRPDMEPEKYAASSNQFLHSLHLTEEKREQLEEETRGQAACPMWKQERRVRLTASCFGKVCHMRSTTSCVNTVESLLYKEIDGPALRYGREHEQFAIEELQSYVNAPVRKCGLFVDRDHSYLAASPDGLIGDDTLVEVKCPFSASLLTPMEAVQKQVLKFCHETEDGRLTLKRSHNYFYQVQGQLHITCRRCCLFVVWTKKGMSVEKITRDDSFWEKDMLPRLERFYKDCLLPELVDPRRSRSMPIRDPDYILQAQAKLKGQKQLSI